MFDVDPFTLDSDNLNPARHMQLSAVAPSVLRSSIVFGVNETPYLDGTLTSSVPDGLYRIRGVFAVDVVNAIRRSNYRAMETVRSNGFVIL